MAFKPRDRAEIREAAGAGRGTDSEAGTWPGKKTKRESLLLNFPSCTFFVSLPTARSQDDTLQLYIVSRHPSGLQN